MEVHGVLSTYELTDKEKELYAEFLQHVMNAPALIFIKYMLGDDYLKFIDILSGMTLKVPSAKSLEKYLESVRIYIYLDDNEYTEDSIKTASKMYNKTVLTTKKYAYRVCKAFGVEDTLEGDALNNYLINIKSVDDKLKKDKDIVSKEGEEKK